MDQAEVSEYTKATWIALVNCIFERWNQANKSPIYYGDLSLQIRGTKKGSRSLEWPLGTLSGEIEAYNLREKSKVPYLNALVVGRRTELPGDGIPQDQDRKDVWDYITEKGKEWLLSFGDHLGLPRSIFYQNRLLLIEETNIVSGRLDNGKGFGYNPSPSTSSEVEGFIRNTNPIHYMICENLRRIGEIKGYSIGTTPGVSPDLYMIKGNESVLIEVKPDSSFNSISHALGQLIFYQNTLKATDVYIVSVGKFIPDESKKILRQHKITWAGCDDNDNSNHISNTLANSIFKA